MHRLIFVALAAFAAGTAAAQEAQRPDPANPRATVPGIEYRSAFTGYWPAGEEKVAPWRQSNDAVKGAGGDDEGHAAPQPAEKPKPEPRPPAGERHGGHR